MTSSSKTLPPEVLRSFIGIFWERERVWVCERERQSMLPLLPWYAELRHDTSLKRHQNDPPLYFQYPGDHRCRTYTPTQVINHTHWTHPHLIANVEFVNFKVYRQYVSGDWCGCGSAFRSKVCINWNNNRVTYTVVAVGVGVVTKNPAPDGVDGVCFSDILGGRGFLTSSCNAVYITQRMWKKEK